MMNQNSFILMKLLFLNNILSNLQMVQNITTLQEKRGSALIHIFDEFSAPHSPFQNGTAERNWHTIFKMARAMYVLYIYGLMQ